jgi:hypothetical protein
MKDLVLGSRKLLGDILDEDDRDHGIDKIQWSEWYSKERNYIIRENKK